LRWEKIRRCRNREPKWPRRSHIEKSFAGTYEVNPKFLLDVRAEDSKLYLRGTGGDYLPLEPTGKDTFFLPATLRESWIPS